jgi:hypothetical protein
MKSKSLFEPLVMGMLIGLAAVVMFFGYYLGAVTSEIQIVQCRIRNEIHRVAEKVGAVDGANPLIQ